VVPLLIESGTWRERVTRVLAIDCSEETQVARVMASNNCRSPGARHHGGQVTRAQRLAAADDVVVNDDGIEALAPQVERLHAFYMASGPNGRTIHAGFVILLRMVQNHGVARQPTFRGMSL
jgi:dephospho-CoA kinase